MTTMNEVLHTFPSDAEIQDIVEALRSERYWILVTRMDGQSLDVISKIQRKYYSASPQDDFVQKIFPFEEGITLADLMGRTNKAIGEHPIMVTRASKSRMTHEQLIDILTPDPKKRNPTVPPLDLHCFILASDAKAWRWIDNLKIALRTYKSGRFDKTAENNISSMLISSYHEVCVAKEGSIGEKRKSCYLYTCHCGHITGIYWE